MYCGSGKDMKFNGFDVVGLDASDEMVKGKRINLWT